ncbi:MAG: LPS-assembly protein LptD [Betaproteobacteria bacterium]|nr:LPS-assembly protein LptD [Betaproteobacteria bacterium]
MAVTCPTPLARTQLARALLGALAVLPLHAGAQVGLTLKPSPRLGDQPVRASDRLPVILEADHLFGNIDTDLTATGNAELRKHQLSLRADTLHYNEVSDLATASGNVRLYRQGNTFSGPQLQLNVSTGAGTFLSPSYTIGLTHGGGKAERVDFIDTQRSVAKQVTYTTCKCAGDGDQPAWLLTADSMRMDFDEEVGTARNVKVTFQGVPILVTPYISFPLSDKRRSGLLPPTFSLSNQTGFEYTQPYYWNIAPNRDYTFSPTFGSRRGLKLGNEFRYLEPTFSGQITANWMPRDNVRGGEERWGYSARHAGNVGTLSYAWDVTRVSDDDYWKDFPNELPSLTLRQLPGSLTITQPLRYGFVQARVLKFQTLQSIDSPLVPPYDVQPQLLLRQQRFDVGGLDFGVDLEASRFAHPTLINGSRVALAPYISYPLQAPGGFLVPKLAWRTWAYHTDTPMSDGRTSASVSVPTLSLDGGLVFERASHWFGRDYTQTLEPRVYYVKSPFRPQGTLPVFDSAAYTLNFATLYTDNAFAGGDRVSDSNTLTLGATTRLLDPATGAEQFRFQWAQRLRFADQNVTIGTPPVTNRVSDALFGVSWLPNPRLTFDSTVQYSPDIGRAVRSAIGTRYTPGPFRTVSASYSLDRSITDSTAELANVAWQWPLFKTAQANWYSVGRVNYSLREKRITDSIAGVEYERDCWLFRIVAQRTSTGQSTATTKIFLQLELTGLGRLGTNPLATLRDNIPQYKVLKEPSGPPDPYANYE